MYGMSKVRPSPPRVVDYLYRRTDHCSK
jgi:hypothetical protein